jgi:Cof subfamily protein (haloacid dehalogenase superfamily)
MNSIRMLAVDLDDTLLRSDLTISLRTRKAIKKAETAGVTVVLASGRTLAAMEPFSRILGMNKRPGYLMCSNGTVIYESQTTSIVYEKTLEPKIALQAFDLADAEGFSVQIYEDDVMYVSRTNEYTDYDIKLTGLRQVVADNFREMASRNCHKLLIPGDPSLLAPLETILRNYLGSEITLFTSKPYFLEILPPLADKGTALAKIAELTGIQQAEVLAIGDSMNDEAMIRWAGVGVAMINGNERIKNIADFVTEQSNDDDGVVDVIEKYILKGGAANE